MKAAAGKSLFSTTRHRNHIFKITHGRNFEIQLPSIKKKLQKFLGMLVLISKILTKATISQTTLQNPLITKQF